jgi:hypothetical protein
VKRGRGVHGQQPLVDGPADVLPRESGTMKHLLAVFTVLALVMSASLAASRTWKSSNGRFSTEAELLDFKDGKVQLRKGDGSEIEVPLASLSEADRKYIKSQFPGVEEENFRPGAEYREWKSRNGKFSALAEFLGCSEGSVQLRKPDGSEISVERKRLSAADERWIADELRRLHEEEQEETKSTEKAGAQEVTGPIAAQDIAMKLVRMDQPTGKGRGKGSVATDYLFRLITPQQFYMQLGKGGDKKESEFRSVVQKEPRYNAPLPFRGVARLGARRYGFALDTTRPQAAGYNRLYFDLNGNGDLTDDKPISAATVTFPTPGMVQSQFPRVDLDLDVDGRPYEYSFLLSAICRKTPGDAYATASLYAAAVREGSITQGSKRTKLLLLDHNSNGRFNDIISFSLASGGAAAEGDLLLVNPNPKNKLSADATMGSDRNFVSKTVCLGKNFYRMEITPAGDSLKLTPTELSLGSVTNPSPAYRAVVFSEDYGTLMIGGTKGQKIPLPESTWKVVNYTIDASGFAGGKGTAVAAKFGRNPPPVSVTKDQTATLPFGAPFHAVVTAHRDKKGKVALSLAIAGVAGEHCTNFYVNGSRPPRPRFLIKDADGKIVHQGSFEYG